MSESSKGPLAKMTMVASLFVLLLVGVYVFLIAIDIVAGAFIYYNTLSAVLGTGAVASVNLAKAISVLFTIAFYLLLPIAVWSYLKFRKVKAAILFGGLNIIWFLFLWGMSVVNPQFIFNPIEGTARYNYYKSVNGDIELFPKEVQYHPQIGVKLSEVTTEVMQEYASKYPERVANLKASSQLITKGASKVCSNASYFPMKTTMHETWKETLAITSLEGNVTLDGKVNIVLGIKNDSYPYNDGIDLSVDDFLVGYLNDSNGIRNDPITVNLPSLNANNFRRLATGEFTKVGLFFEDVQPDKSYTLFWQGLRIGIDCS